MGCMEPIFDSQCRVLLLSAVPSPRSRATGRYFAHPGNRMWQVLSAVLDDPAPADPAERPAYLLRHHIAVWEVMDWRPDAEPSSHALTGDVADMVPNDLARVLDGAPIACAATVGGRASRLYNRFDAERWPELPRLALPSTSTANRRTSWDQLVAAYRALLPYLRD